MDTLHFSIYDINVYYNENATKRERRDDARFILIFRESVRLLVKLRFLV